MPRFKKRRSKSRKPSKDKKVKKVKRLKRHTHIDRSVPYSPDLIYQRLEDMLKKLPPAIPAIMRKRSNRVRDILDKADKKLLEIETLAGTRRRSIRDCNEKEPLLKTSCILMRDHEKGKIPGSEYHMDEFGYTWKERKYFK